MIKYYSAIILFAVLITIVLIVLTTKNNELLKKTRIGFIVSAVLIIVAACCEYTGVMIDGSASNLRPLHLLVKFLELSIVPVIPVVYGNAICPVKSIWKIVMPIALHTLLEFLSMWFGITFFVDASNVYMHCNLYYIYYVAYFVGFLFMVIQISRFCTRYQNQNKLGLVLIMLFLFLGIGWQAIDSSMRVVWLAMAVGDVLFYVFYCDILQQIDSLTGLLNRRNYENRTKELKTPVIILFADIDNFKSINDNYGHQAGDRILAIVGQTLMESYKKYGLCYRVGGDEFSVILTRQFDAVKKCNSDFFTLLNDNRKKEPLLPHVSVGYAEFDPENMTVSQAVAKADAMMYEYKNKRKSVDND